MKRLRWLATLVLLVVLVGTGGYAVAQIRQPEPAYSTATATRADLERTLDLSGTVAATGRRDLGFGTSGKVARVAVKAGQRVRKGQVLARLDATALEADVTSAESTLARARAQLAADEDAQDAAVATAAKPRVQKPRGLTQPSKPATPAKPDPALQQALAEVAAGQKAVTAAQTAASAAIAAAKAALTDQKQKCQAPDDATGTGEGDGPDQGGTSSGLHRGTAGRPGRAGRGRRQAGPAPDGARLAVRDAHQGRVSGDQVEPVPGQWRLDAGWTVPGRRPGADLDPVAELVR